MAPRRRERAVRTEILELHRRLAALSEELYALGAVEEANDGLPSVAFRIRNFLLAVPGPSSPREIASALGLANHPVRAVLSLMVQQGEVERVAQGVYTARPKGAPPRARPARAALPISAVELRHRIERELEAAPETKWSSQALVKKLGLGARGWDECDARDRVAGELRILARAKRLRRVAHGLYVARTSAVPSGSEDRPAPLRDALLHLVTTAPEMSAKDAARLSGRPLPNVRTTFALLAQKGLLRRVSPGVYTVPARAADTSKRSPHERAAGRKGGRGSP